MINKTATFENAKTCKIVSSQSGPSPVDQVLQLRQELAASQKLVVDLQKQLSEREFKVQVQEKVEMSPVKDSTQQTLHCQSTLPNLLANQGQELTAGAMGGGDVGGRGEIAGASTQIDKKTETAEQGQKTETAEQNQKTETAEQGNTSKQG